MAGGDEPVVGKTDVAVGSTDDGDVGAEAHPFPIGSAVVEDTEQGAGRAQHGPLRLGLDLDGHGDRRLAWRGGLSLLGLGGESVAAGLEGLADFLVRLQAGAFDGSGQG